MAFPIGFCFATSHSMMRQTNEDIRDGKLSSQSITYCRCWTLPTILDLMAMCLSILAVMTRFPSYSSNPSTFLVYRLRVTSRYNPCLPVSVTRQSLPHGMPQFGSGHIKIAVSEGSRPVLFSWLIIRPLHQFLSCSSVWAVVASIVIVPTAAARILSALLLRTRTHRHAFEPQLLGDLLSHRVLACFGGVLLFLLCLLLFALTTLAATFFFLLLRCSGTGGGG